MNRLARPAASLVAAVVVGASPAALPSVGLAQEPVPGESVTATQATRSPYVAGLGQVAKRYPIAGARVLAETLRGKPLSLRWGRSKALRRTQSSGAFVLPRHGLPKHFVVVLCGGRIHGRKAKGVFRAVVDRSPRGEVAQVSLGTTVQTDVYRSMRGKRGYSARALRKAHNRTLRTVRLPRYLVLGWDDRVNPRFIRGVRLQRYAKKYGGYGPLARRVEWLVRHNKKIPLSTPVGGSTPVRSADVVDDCTDAVLGFTPESLAKCAASGALAIVSAAFGPAPSSQILADLQQVNTDLAGLSQQLSDLQAEVNSGFLDLVAQADQDEYDAAARELLPTTSAIQAELTAVSQLAANVPGKAPAVVVNQQLNALIGQLNPAAPGSVLSATTATELADGTVATGAGGLGTLPAAWQAVRAQQQTGSLGTTAQNGDAALGQGTTLYTNEMSMAFASPGAYWFNQLWLLGVLTANYYNYLYTEDGLTPAQVTAETADVIGGFSASGTCPSPAPSPSPVAPQVACPGSISANLWQQIETAPMTVPPGTVIDPTTNLVWGSALLDDVTGTTTGSGLPNDPATGNSLVPELVNQVNDGATGPWPGVNPNLLALATAGVADQGAGTWSWSLPTANQENQAATSPQFGSLGGSSGLFGGLVSGSNPNSLGGITSPPAFPPTLDMWANSGVWAFNVGLGTGWLPSGVIQYLDDCSGTPLPQYPGFNGFCGSFGGNPQYPPNAVSAPVVLNASIPGAYYGYPAVYPKALLLDPQELIYQISLFRYVEPPPNPQ